MPRPVIPITTGLQYAPVGEAFSEQFPQTGCLRERDCRFTNPFQDRHHQIFGQDLSEAEQLLMTHPDFITTMCRDMHMSIHRTWDRSEPLSDDFAIGYLIASPLNLCAGKMKKLKDLRRSING